MQKEKLYTYSGQCDTSLGKVVVFVKSENAKDAECDMRSAVLTVVFCSAGQILVTNIKRTRLPNKKHRFDRCFTTNDKGERVFWAWHLDFVK